MIRTTLAMAIAIGAAGCQRGVAPLWTQANPETVISVRYNPWTGTWDFDGYDNNGRAIQLENMELIAGDKSIKIDKLNITERSVENRLANVEQMQVTLEMTRAWTDLFKAIVPMIGKTVTDVKAIDSRNNLDRIGDVGRVLNDNPLLQPDEALSNPPSPEP